MSLLDPPALSRSYFAARASHLATKQESRNALSIPLLNPAGIPNLDFWLDAQDTGGGSLGWDSFDRTAQSAAAPGNLGNMSSGNQLLVTQGTAAITRPAITTSNRWGARLVASAAPAAVQGNFLGPDHIVYATVILNPTLANVDVRIRARLNATADNNNYIEGQLVWNAGAGAIQSLINRMKAGVVATQSTITLNGSAWGNLVGGALVVVALGVSGNVYTMYVGNNFYNFIPVSVNSWTDAANQANINNTYGGFAWGAGDSASYVVNLGAVAAACNAGSPLTTWSDKARPDQLQSAVQNNVANQPPYVAAGINGKPSAQFTGTPVGMLSPASASEQTFSVIAVVEPTSLAAQGAIIGASASGGMEWIVGTDGSMTLNKARQAAIGASKVTYSSQPQQLLAVNTPAIVEVDYDANGAFAFYVNGVAQDSTGLNPLAFVAALTMSIGFDTAGGNTDYFVGYIGEIIRYSRVLLGHERRRLVQALATKWGIALPQKTGLTTNANLNIAGPIKGANLQPRQPDFAFGDGSGWYGMWYQWYNGDGHSQAFIQASIDAAAALGANSFRVFGDIGVVFNGGLTQTQFNNAFAAVAAYAQSKGLALHVTAGDLRHTCGADPAFIVGYVTSLAQALAAYPVVIFEPLQEIDGSLGTFGERWTFMLCRALAANVRNLGYGWPISFSKCVQVQRGGADYGRSQAWDALVDVWDFHIYDATLNSYFLAPITTMTEKPIIVGEYGTNSVNGSGSAARTAFVQSYGSLVSSNEQILGGHFWAALGDDFDNPTIVLATWGNTGSRSSAGPFEPFTLVSDVATPYAALAGGALF